MEARTDLILFSFTKTSVRNAITPGLIYLYPTLFQKEFKIALKNTLYNIKT